MAVIGSRSVGLTVPIRYVRAGVSLAARQDWDIVEVMHDAGVPPALLDELRSRVTTEQATRLAQAMWRLTDDEVLGLGPSPVPRGTFRLLCYGMIGSTDAREAMTRFSMFLRSLPALPQLKLNLEGEQIRVEADLSAYIDDVEGLLTDTMLAIVHRFLGWLLGRRLPLLAVEVPYPRPDDLSVYSELFGQVPTFETRIAALVLSAEILDAPVMRTEAELEEFLAIAPEGILARREHGSTLTDQVRRLLEADLSADLSADEVAGRLNLATPTLRRKLREEGSSFRQVREDLLRDAAVQALVHTTETVAEIAERLGFSETSAFTRAFGRWTGLAPAVYRSAVIGSQPPTT